MTLDIKTAHILEKYKFLPQKIIKIQNSKLLNFTTQPDLGKGSTFYPLGEFLHRKTTHQGCSDERLSLGIREKDPTTRIPAEK